MKLRCRALGIIIPIPTADVLSGLFSEQEWARRFMIKTWELLDMYSKERRVDNSDPNYPNRFFKEDGPVPILIASGINLPFAAVVHRAFGRGHDPFRWTDDEYRYAILALRAVSHSCSEGLMLMVSSVSRLSIMSMATRSQNMHGVPTVENSTHAGNSSPLSLRYRISLDPEILGTRIKLDVVDATCTPWYVHVTLRLFMLIDRSLALSPLLNMLITEYRAVCRQVRSVGAISSEKSGI